jgi:DNA-binding CsgD family transcriptional regulator
MLIPPAAPSQVLTAVADTLAYPLMALLPDGRLLYANRAALAALHAGLPLAMDAEGRVVPASDTQRAPFLHALRRAAEGERRALVWADEPVPLHAWVCPLDPQFAGVQGAAGTTLPETAVMLLQTPPVGQLLDVAGFAAQHGLSAAEARVLQQLLAGRTTREAATALGVGIATVRTHVLSISRKTGHRGVPALLAALGALPPLWPADAP